MLNGEVNMAAKVKRAQVTEAAEAIRWTTHGDDAAAAEETRKRAKLCGPDAVALLRYVLTVDDTAPCRKEWAQRRCCSKSASFLASEPKPTGLFDTEDMTGSNGRKAS
jgi:hypothetical protein